MAVQHVNITDANRHENKHASTAQAGQVLKANGDGTTAFTNPDALNNVTIASTLEASSTSTQNPTTTNTALQVTFGSATSNADVDIAATGVVTIKTAGLYLIEVLLNASREDDTLYATVAARMLVNDVAVGNTSAVSIGDNLTTHQIKLTQFRKLPASNTVKVQIIRDSLGEDDGGLVSSPISAVGWAESPSAYIRVQKIGGGF